MAKFYVESGSFRGIVDSDNAETAAVWVIHRVMQPPRSQEQSDADGLFRLQDDIRVSERGFGRSKAKRIETRDAFSNWVRTKISNGQSRMRTWLPPGASHPA